MSDNEKAAQALAMLQKARFQIITDRRLTFFGVVMMNLKPVPAKWVETAAVDGRHMFFNPDFILGLTPAQVKGVVCHEVGHVTGFHFDRLNGRQELRWNIATDIKINAGLRDMKIDLPTGAVYGDHSHQRMTCEEVYNSLPPTKVINMGPGGKDGFEVKDQGGCGTMIEPRDANGKKLTPAEARAVEHAQRATIEEAARMAKAQGSMPQFVERLIDEANNEPLPWAEILKRFVDRHVKRDYTWTRPNRRMIGQGVYLPSQRIEGVGDIVIAVDSSGSISQGMLSVFIKEAQSIMDDTSPAHIHVIVCDAHVHSVGTFERGDVIDIKLMGGGGTAFEPVFQEVQSRGFDPLCLIFMTDGMGSYGPEPDYPVLWALTGEYNVPWGEKLRLNMEN